MGIITGVSILTPRLPEVRVFPCSHPNLADEFAQAVNVAVLCVPDFVAVQKVFKETRTKLGEILSAFEFFDQEGLDLVLKHTGQKRPFADEPVGGRAFYVLIETSGSNKDHDDEVRHEFLWVLPVLTYRALAETGRIIRASSRIGNHLRRRSGARRNSSSLPLVAS